MTENPPIVGTLKKFSAKRDNPNQAVLVCTDTDSWSDGFGAQVVPFAEAVTALTQLGVIYVDPADPKWPDNNVKYKVRGG